MISEPREACRNFVRLAARRVGRAVASGRIGATSRRGASDVGYLTAEEGASRSGGARSTRRVGRRRAQRELQRTLVVVCVDAVSRAFIEAGKRTWMSR
ncbi:MAG: hypothetical protein K0R38_4452 [Polyangiaceae bacterium]|nr:hypothetical protein [Polyangiaceae bacterium]